MPTAGYRMQDSGFWIRDFGFMPRHSGIGIQDAGWGIRDSGFWDSGFQIPDCGVRDSEFGLHPGWKMRDSGLGISGFVIPDGCCGVWARGFGLGDLGSGLRGRPAPLPAGGGLSAAHVCGAGVRSRYKTRAAPAQPGVTEGPEPPAQRRYGFLCPPRASPPFFPRFSCFFPQILARREGPAPLAPPRKSLVLQPQNATRGGAGSPELRGSALPAG